MGNLSCKISSSKINNTIHDDELFVINVNKINNIKKELYTSDNHKLISNFGNYFYSSTPKFNEALNNEFLVARVVDIYDGDIVTCILNVFNGYFLFDVRLGDIDACGIKSKNINCRIKAHDAQNYLYKLITKKINNNFDINRIRLRSLLESEVYLVNILCGTFDKYGRLLGWIFDLEDLSQDKTKSFNYILVDKKLAYIHKGEQKLTEEKQLELLL